MRETVANRVHERTSAQTDAVQRGERFRPVDETGPNHRLRGLQAGRGPVRVDSSQARVRVADPAFRLPQLLHHRGSCLVEDRPLDEEVEGRLRALAADRCKQAARPCAAEEPGAAHAPRSAFDHPGRDVEVGGPTPSPECPCMPLQFRHGFGKLSAQLRRRGDILQQPCPLVGRPQQLGARLPGADGRGRVVIRRHGIRRRGEGGGNPVRKRLAFGAIPCAKQCPGVHIGIGAVHGHVHGTVVGRRDEHRFPVEPGVRHRVDDQLGLPRAGRPRDDGQRLATKPVESRLLGVVAGERRGERVRRGEGCGARGIQPFDKTGRCRLRPILSARQRFELGEQESGRAAAVIRRDPDGCVVHPGHGAAMRAERSRVEVGNDIDPEHLGDASRHSHQRLGISERHATANDRVGLLLRGHVEQLAGDDCRIELRLGLCLADPAVVALLGANGNLEQGGNDRMVLLVSRDQHRPSVDERGVAPCGALRIEMPPKRLGNGCPVLSAGDQVFRPRVVQKTCIVEFLQRHKRVRRLGKHTSAQISAQSRPWIVGAG